MEFISAEEFLKQDEEVQKVFLDWWEPSEGDIYSYIDLGERCRDCISQRNIDFFKRTCSEIEITLKEWLLKKRKNCIPLLTEGQVRKFIEDKTDCKISYNIGECGYQITLYKFKEGNLDEEHKVDYFKDFSPIDLNTCSLLQSYWKVAVEIAKESLNKNNKINT